MEKKRDELISAGDASYLNLLRLLYQKTPDDDKSDSEGGTPDGADKKADSPTFTPEQQKHIDTILLPTRLRRERERLEKEMKSRGLTDEEKQELDRYRTAERERAEQDALTEKKRLEEQGQYKKIIADTETKYKSQLTERDEIIGTLMTERQERNIDQAISLAIAPHATKIVAGSERYINFALRAGFPLTNNDTVYRIQADLDEESGNTTIKLVDQRGIPLLNEKAQEMTLTQAVGKLLELNPQFVVANMRGGSGSTGGGSNIDSLKGQLEKASEQARKSGKRSDLQEYMRLRNEVKKASQA